MNAIIDAIRRRLILFFLLTIGVLVVVGTIAPFISAGRYGHRIQASLEASLGRKVSIGRVHFTLFAGPGFSINDVTIGEDPRYGIEPCAYVPVLEARVRLDKLLKGQVQFAELRLEGAEGIDPTLNLVKRSDGTWNVIELLERLGRGGNSWNFLPALEINGARLNLKFGERKSILYIDDADIVAYTESSGKVRIRFAGTPSRTDRSGHGFSSLQGDANWYLRPSADNPNQLEANVWLEQSNLSEMITLVEGYDIGIHGSISSHLQISGPANALQVHGDLRLEDVHRWDLTPSSGEDWNVHFGGLVDLANNRIQLETASTDPRKPTPVVLQVRVSDFLTAPTWSIIARLKQAPAENLLPLSRRLGLGLPAELSAKGRVNGAVGYSSHSGWNGAVALEDVTATIPDLPVFHAPSTTLSIASDHIYVEPSLVENPAGAALLISGDYIPSTRRLGINLRAQGVPVTSLTATLESWFGKPPVFTSFKAGTVTGQLQYVNAPPEEPEWSGEFQLAKASLEPPGVGTVIRDFSGRFALEGEALDVSRFAATAGGESITGEYHYRPKGTRRERLRIQAGKVDLAAIEKLFGPAFGPQDFFSRFRFGRRTLPAWLAHRNLEADVLVHDLSVDGTELGPAKAHFIWTGPSIEATTMHVALAGGEMEAAGKINLTNAHPSYSFSGDVSNLPWKRGLIDISGDATSSGMGDDALANLQATGEFSAHDVSPTSDVTFSSMTGKYKLTFESGWPHLQLTQVAADQVEETWLGSGASDKDGALVLDLADGPRQMHVMSTLDPSVKPETPVANTAGIAH